MKCFSVLKEPPPTSLEVSHIKWSPCIDLLAVCNERGDVFVQRRSWRRAWHLTAPGEGVTVTGCCWAPSGDYFAVAYSTNQVAVCNIDNGSVVHELQDVPGIVTSLFWFSAKLSQHQKAKKNDASLYGTPNISTAEGKFLVPELADFDDDYFAPPPDFLPPLPLLDSEKSDAEFSSFFLEATKDTSMFSCLVVVCGAQIHIYAYAFLHLATLNLSSIVNNLPHSDCGLEILSLQFSESLDHFLVCYTSHVPASENEQQASKQVQFSLFESPLFSEHAPYVAQAVKIVAKILTTETYLAETMQNMKNGWDDILLGIDKKFAQFAKSKFMVDGGTVGDAFLAFLVVGEVSAELEQFLLHELTEKGLKRFGSSVENTYTNLQKLVSFNFEAACLSLYYHLALLRRWAMFSETDFESSFERIGVSEEIVVVLMKTVGAAMLKISELQKVIAQNHKNLKEFFRWLYWAILTVSDSASSQTPSLKSALPELTQDDMNFIAKFIEENFFVFNENDPVLFKLEKVGQYLRDEPLKILGEHRNEKWFKFLERYDVIRQHPLMFNASDPTASLVQVVQKVHESLKEFRRHMCSAASACFRLVKTETVVTSANQVQALTSFTSGVLPVSTPSRRPRKPPPPPPDNFRLYLRLQNEQLLLLGINSSTGDLVAKTVIGFTAVPHKVDHFDLYKPDVLALLLTSDKLEMNDATGHLEPKQFLVLRQWIFFSSPAPLDQKLQAKRSTPQLPQAPETVFADWSLPPHVDNMALYLCTEILSPTQFDEIHVCGEKKNGCLLSTSRTQLRLLDMEVEDEEDTSAMSALNTSAESNIDR